MPSNNEYRNPAPSYEITMEEFRARLKCIKKGLHLRRGVYMGPGKANFDYFDDDEDWLIKVLRFFSLDKITDDWDVNRTMGLTETTYRQLDVYLSKRDSDIRRDLEDRWKASYSDWKSIPENEFVKELVENLLDPVFTAYGVPKLNDGRIISILGMILLWLSALPCTKDAEDARNQYRDNLKSKLKRLLGSEFSVVAGEAVIPLSVRNMKVSSEKEYQSMIDEVHKLEDEIKSYVDRPMGKSKGG